MSWIGAIRKGPDLSTCDHSSPWLVDEFVDRYVRWRETSAGVKEAYERWTSGENGKRAVAFTAYRAALDSEELAARAYQECAERIAGRTR